MPSATTLRVPKGRTRRTVLSVLAVLVLALPLVLATAQDEIVAPRTRDYVADTLWGARYDTGAVQAQWLGRPFWVEPATGRGVRVAIIDTGIDAEHPDLSGSVVAWRDFIEGRPRPYDDDTHGTHVAGIVGARGHWQLDPFEHYFPFGARGVAPDVDLIVAKAMDDDGNGDATTVAKAILWALDPNGDGDLSDGAHVINLSIGIEASYEKKPQLPSGLPVLTRRSKTEMKVLEDAIAVAYDAGAIVVVAAGNHDSDSLDETVTFPGTLSTVITVGATDGDGRVARFSNPGAPGSGKPDLVAPGVVLSTYPTSGGDGYRALGGTSMAAPMVTGAVALMLEGDPTLKGLEKGGGQGWKTERVRNVLVATAGPVGTPESAGAGVLRIDAALAAVDRGDGPIAYGRIVTLLVVVFLLSVWVVSSRRRARKRQVRRSALITARARRAALLLATRPAPEWLGREDVLRARVPMRVRPLRDENSVATPIGDDR